LYRIYSYSSHTRKQWNPDTTFHWNAIRKDLSQSLLTIIEGYYAIEQFVPDYTSEATRLCRRNYGRAQFQLIWGAEEAKHSDVWRNVLLFTGAHTINSLEELSDNLRTREWKPPITGEIETLLYVVLQERATQLIYLNTASVARGCGTGRLSKDKDPVIEHVALIVAADEAAHYRFFLDCARLYLYYFPNETLQAFFSVLRQFIMPAANLFSGYEAFVSELYAAKIFGRVMYVKDVVSVVAEKIGIKDLKALEAKILASTGFDSHLDITEENGINVSIAEKVIGDLFRRIEQYEQQAGSSSCVRTCSDQNT
jgi:acyl-[acyl-carrier-protein] desaturase